jgi:hypothetical protein
MHLCGKVLSELMSSDQSKWFFVNDIQNIQNPMGFEVIKKQIDENHYNSALEFAADVRLIFTNCYQYAYQHQERMDKCRELNEMFETAYWNNIECDSECTPGSSSNSDPIENKTKSESAFVCEPCKMSFKSKYSLIRHNLSKHENKLVFPCDMCVRRFGQKSNLQRHKDTVHNKKISKMEKLFK